MGLLFLFAKSVGERSHAGSRNASAPYVALSGIVMIASHALDGREAGRIGVKFDQPVRVFGKGNASMN
jgi:hypothetical protein